MTSKHQLLTSLREEFERWQKLLASLSEDQIVAHQLPSGLSVKDVVAHLWSWQRLSAARLEAALKHREPDFHLGPPGLLPDTDDNEQINTWIHETNADRRWRDIYRDWRSGFLRFLELGEALPEADLMEPGKYAWLPGYPLASVLEGSFDHHHEEHYLPLHAWLKDHGFTIID